LGGGHRGAQRGTARTTGLLGRGEQHLIPLATGLLAALTAPLDDAPVGLPGHDLVDAHLGGRLDRLIVTVVLGEGLDEDEAGRRLLDARHVLDAQGEFIATGGLHGPDHEGAFTVGELEPLPHRGPAHRDRVPGLGTAQADAPPALRGSQPTGFGEIQGKGHPGIPVV